MGKPSVTNIQPPATPPKTVWDLNSPADITAAGGNYLGHADAGYAAKVGSINTVEPSARPDVTPAELDGYDYVFFGVNGGSNETVKGVDDLAGVIVTGNGKDSITGGDLGDMVWAGNGKDTVHGGGGDDVIYGENGPDTLYGDSDHGSAYLIGGAGGLVLNDGAVVAWASDPNGTHVGVNVPNKTTVAKEGIYVALDGNNHPTELDAQGHPVIHVVYSVTPETTGSYTLAYNHGNQLDGPGNPSFPGDHDQETVSLVAGQKYYFSFIYDPTDSAPVRVNVYGGSVVVTNPINGGTNPDPAATSQALPGPDWADLFHTTDGGTHLQFVAGDQLIGGEGPDKFVYDRGDANSVDLIWDYNQGAGVADPLEGDTLVLLHATAQDLSGATIYQNADLGGGQTGLVIRFDANHAIGLVGVASLADVTVVFG